MTPARKATLLLLSTTVIWGSTFPICKLAVTDAVARGSAEWPAVYALWTARFIIAAVLFAFVPRALSATRREWWGAFMITWPGAIGLALQGRSLVGSHTSSAIVAFLTNLMVVFTPIFGFLFFREKVPRALIVGAIVALAGVFLLTNPTGGRFGAEEWLALGSAVIFGLQLQFVNRYTAGANAEAMTFAMFVHFAWMNAAALLLSPGAATAASIVTHPGGKFWLSCLYLAAVGSAFAMWIFMAYQRHIPASRAAVIYCLEPVFAAVIGLFMHNEVLSWRIFAGGALILGANLLVELRKPKEA